MTYKLALALKNAGFPSKYKDVQFDIASGGKSSPTRVAITPTLSELIEAIGDEFQVLLLREDKRWGAHSKEWNVIGKTPKIAVAKLWLKLNKKPT